MKNGFLEFYKLRLENLSNKIVGDLSTATYRNELDFQYEALMQESRLFVEELPALIAYAESLNLPTSNGSVLLPEWRKLDEFADYFSKCRFDIQLKASENLKEKTKALKTILFPPN